MSRKKIIDKYELDPLLIKQVFLINFINCSYYKFFDLLDKLGDYRAGCIFENDKFSDYAIVNTNFTISKLKKMFDKYKEEKDNVAIVGMTIDMMENLKNFDDRDWCLELQRENMDYVLSKTQQKHNQEMNEIIDKVEKELEKIKREKEVNG